LLFCTPVIANPGVFVACSGRKLAYALVENMLMQLCSFAVVEKLLMYLVFCSIFVCC
jgi:hypothetical protein